MIRVQSCGKKVSSFGVFFFPLGFCNFLWWGRETVWGIEDVRHDLLCLNVFECFFLYAQMSMSVDIKEETLSKRPMYPVFNFELIKLQIITNKHIYAVTATCSVPQMVSYWGGGSTKILFRSFCYRPLPHLFLPVDLDI